MNNKTQLLADTELNAFDYFVNQSIRLNSEITTGQAVNLWQIFQQSKTPITEQTIYTFLKNELDKEDINKIKEQFSSMEKAIKIQAENRSRV